MNQLRITLTVLILITMLAACTQDEEKSADKKETVAQVETTTVTKGDLIIERSIYGRTAPSRTSPILLQTPGEITSLEVQNGDQVEEDDVIATIQSSQGTQTIYAETAGQIAQLKSEEGTIVTNQEPFAVIVDLDELTLNLTVTAEATSLFEQGDKYPVIINETEIDAEITSIGTLPDETGLYPIEAKIIKEDDALLPGMVAEMSVPENTIEDALIIPTEAVVQESDKSFIYIIQDGKAVEKSIEVIETQSDKTAFQGDVKKDDQVVTSGQLTLSDGTKVNVVKEG
ncbi:efflux RND transporter periplasmic adaptor subunit [Virgibacillus necropolis]|uniref:Efflux transporter periplasmic adaptor subunit n=1 Tax=Virgibacillus necropolis TaxID=163877 RepID=A0A221M8Z4_9BACI|nr:efflux RND transporter periplasmic adaptor subunit [Virgibacillus necropolis]ASN04101.1 efflux transporter periplasmic adaptor subunit [Virgibacillus necropolis]